MIIFLSICFVISAICNIILIYEKINETKTIYLSDDDVIVLKNGTYYRYRLDKEEELATYTGIEDYFIRPN